MRPIESRHRVVPRGSTWPRAGRRSVDRFSGSALLSPAKSSHRVDRATGCSDLIELKKLANRSAFVQSQPARFRRVCEESFRLGTRCISYAKNTDSTIRFYLEPELESVRYLNVFVSYTSVDEPWAISVVEELRLIGFQVEFFPCVAPTEELLTNERIESRLLEALNRADYLCMLFSDSSKDRPWVLFEVEHAARLIGRLVLVRNGTVTSVSDLSIPKFQSDEFAIGTVKHTVANYDESDAERSMKIARLIINDPDEGVSDGTYRPDVIRERNLKHESLMRRYARERIGALRAYASRNVVDVVPFFLSDVRDELDVQRGDSAAVVAWHARHYGRLNQALHLTDSQYEPWECEWETFPVPEQFETWTEEEFIEAIVIVNPQFSDNDKFWSTCNKTLMDAQFGVSRGRS